VRCVFFGTPPIALPTLTALTEIGEVVAVVCQPDRLGGRGLKPIAPAVKRWAQERQMRVIQPDNLKDGELARWVASELIDVCVVLAYGKILPKSLLDAPRRGCLNLHASLLPRHRGAAPIQWSILSGDTETGVTLMQMDVGLDTGPILSQHSIPIEPRENTGALTERMGELCAKVTRVDIPRYLAGDLQPLAQDAERATWAPPIKAADRRLDFSNAAAALAARVRALSPQPGAMTQCRGKLLRILETQTLAESSGQEPGTVTVSPENRILIATRAGSLELLRGQFEGKKPLGARDLINGRSLVSNDHLGG